MRPGRNDACPCGSGRKFKHCCGRAAADSPAPPSARPDASRAWALLNGGRTAEAEVECRRLLSLVPLDGPVLVCLGLALQAQGKDALATFESASRRLPDDAQVHYLLAQALDDHGLAARAAESLARAVALRPDFAEAHNDLGHLQLQLGQTDAAIASCRRALQLQPRFAAALGNLANAERARGALAAAIDGYRRVIALEPRLAEAHHHLGTALIEAGQRDAGIDCLRRALELRPDYPGAVAQLARALVAAGRAADAIPYYERLLARTAHAEALHDYANLLAGLGQFEAAARRYREAIPSQPGNARLRSNLAHALHCLGDFRGAIDESRRALGLDPHLPEAHLHLGNALLALSEVHAAAASYRAGLAVAVDHPGLLTGLAMAERALGQLDAAEASARRALAARPHAADALALLGNLAGERGRFDEAERLLGEALGIDPELPEALVGLTRVRKLTSADAEWRAAAGRALARGLPVGHRISLYHAVGKFHDDTGEYDAAFEHHRDGNELARRSGLTYDREATTRRFGRTVGAFGREVLGALQAPGPQSALPVFVIGMPRSGTTLAEQILASHPDVHGAGELLYWNFAADVERAAPAGERASTIARLGREYLETLATLAPAAARVVDKLPGNFENAGLIHAALPAAKFIHLERHPLDTCLSIYLQGFSTAHAYATDFGDLAHCYREYRRLMEHWRATLPAGTLLDVPYEALVDDPEAWSRRMLAHAGLAWDPLCLEFHRNERPVLTASSWQVRQPISRGSLGRWRRYERFIGPLRQALGDALGSELP